MRDHQFPSIVICSLYHLNEALRHYRPQHVISILSNDERMRFPTPSFGKRRVLEEIIRLEECNPKPASLTMPLG